MIKRIVQSWWLILGIIILWPEGSLWEINAAEWFATGAIVLGATLTVWRWWHEYRQKTVIRLKHVSHSWEITPPEAGRTFDPILAVVFEIKARELYQATYVKGIIGGRHCYGLPTEFMATRNGHRTIRFNVPRDASRQENYGHMELEFGGRTFQSEVFRVTPAPSTPDMAGSPPKGAS